MPLLDEQPEHGEAWEPDEAEHRPRRALVAIIGGVALIVGLIAVWQWSARSPTGRVDEGASEGRRGDTTASSPAPAPRPAPSESLTSASPPGERRARPRRAAPAPEAPSTPAEPEAVPTVAMLQVDSDVPGASVFLDRTYVGVTPLSVKDIATGSHRLNVSADGYDGYAETIEIASEPRSIVVRFKEVRLDEAAAVVHRHGMGSCEGRLHADPHALRYETSNRGDGFVLPLSELQVFEVDYLKHNLRIVRRGGRTYNFTDKTANADALFLFHKNVESARAKLAKGWAPAGAR